jgi:hypothetical protein
MIVEENLKKAEKIALAQNLSNNSNGIAPNKFLGKKEIKIRANKKVEQKNFI